MRIGRVALFAAALVALATAAPRAEGGSWADLARRIAATDPDAQQRVALGVEPPHFAYPLPARPALAVRGSTWLASKPDEPPQLAHVYYVASGYTETVSRALFAALLAAGYTRATTGDSRYGGGSTTSAVYCKADAPTAEVDVSIDTYDDLPAMDVTFSTQRAASLTCRSRAFGWTDDAHTASLTDIPGVTLSQHLTSIGGVRNSAQTTSTVRTTLPAAEAVARIAERFTTRGWSSAPALVNGSLITQRFSRADGSHRWDAFIVLNRRAEGLYCLLVDLEGSPQPAGG